MARHHTSRGRHRGTTTREPADWAPLTVLARLLGEQTPGRHHRTRRGSATVTHPADGR